MPDLPNVSVPLDRLRNLRLPRPNRALRRDKIARLTVLLTTLALLLLFKLHTDLHGLRLETMRLNAYSLQKQGRDPKRAIAHLWYYLHYSPKNPEAHYRLGLLLKADNPQDAASLFERAIDLGWDDISVHRHLGDAMWAMRRRRGARLAYAEFLRFATRSAQSARKYANQITHVRTALRQINAN